MSEERIDRLLKALGSAEPPPGMERRILARLDEVETAGSRVGWGWPVRSVAFAVVLCLAVVLPMHYRTRRAVVRKGDVAASASPKTASTAVAESAMPHEAKVNAGSVKVVHRAVKGPVVARHEELAEESVGALENRPAPPMPLTEEERLLLQIAHRGAQKEYAMLDAGMRAARDADDKAEFKEFFTDPAFLVPLKIENNQ